MKVRVFVLVTLLAALVFAAMPATPQREVSTRLDTLVAYTDCYGRLTRIFPTWRITVAYLPDSTGRFSARTYSNASYYWATVTFDSVRVAAMDDAELRRTVVHEVVAHVLTGELFELAARTDSVLARRLSEQLATQIERWFFWPHLCPWKDS